MMFMVKECLLGLADGCKQKETSSFGDEEGFPLSLSLSPARLLSQVEFPAWLGRRAEARRGEAGPCADHTEW